MRAILIANAKGGCGKTTFATTLASALAASGRRVAIADADPQRSSVTWLARRPSGAPRIHAIDCAPPPRRGDRAMRRIGWWREVWRAARAQARRAKIDVLIIDAPAGALETESGLSALVSKVDLVIAPVAPSIYDEHATRRFLARLENAPALRDGEVELLLVANRVRRSARRERTLGAAFARFFSRLGLTPVTEIAEGAAYPILAAEGLALFDPGVESAAPRKTARMRAEWAPLLSAMGLTAARAA